MKNSISNFKKQNERRESRTRSMMGNSELPSMPGIGEMKSQNKNPRRSFLIGRIFGNDGITRSFSGEDSSYFFVFGWAFGGTVEASSEWNIFSETD